MKGSKQLVHAGAPIDTTGCGALIYVRITGLSRVASIALTGVETNIVNTCAVAAVDGGVSTVVYSDITVGASEVCCTLA